MLAGGGWCGRLGAGLCRAIGIARAGRGGYLCECENVEVWKYESMKIWKWSAPRTLGGPRFVAATDMLHRPLRRRNWGNGRLARSRYGGGRVRW